MTDPEDNGGGVYTLPDRATLDPRSAAALAVNAELDRQLQTQPDAVIAIDPTRLADAVLNQVGDYPVVPRWVEARTVGGRRTDNPADGQEAEIRVDVDDTGVILVVQGETGPPAEDGTPSPAVELTIHLGETDAEQWFLEGLAAVRAARAIE